MAPKIILIGAKNVSVLERDLRKESDLEEAKHLA